MVDAILLVGQDDVDYFLSEFYLYVGHDSDYSKNTPCPGGPFAYPLDSTYGTIYLSQLGYGSTGSEWQNGVEAWCNLQGSYVNFVREAEAQPPLDEVRICTFGVLSGTIHEKVDEPKQLFDALYPAFMIMYE